MVVKGITDEDVNAMWWLGQWGIACIPFIGILIVVNLAIGIPASIQPGKDEPITASDADDTEAGP